MNGKRINSIDFLRVISILSIFIYHYSCTVQAYGYNPDYFMIIGEMATFGVSFFIIISGAVLNNRNDKFNIIQFYKKRIKGIYPSFWVAYTAFSLYAFFKYNAISLSDEIGKFIMTITGFDGWLIWMGPNSYLVGEWFIGFILILYAITPIIAISSKKYPYLCMMASFVISAISFYMHDKLIEFIPFMNPNPMWNPTTRLFEFVCGAILINKIINGNVNRLVFEILSIIVIILYVASGVKISNTFICIPLFISSFVLISLLYERFKNEYSCRLFTFLSGYSFMIFLTHHRMMFEISSSNTLNLHGIFQFMFGLFSCLTLCFIISHYLNKIVALFK